MLIGLYSLVREHKKAGWNTSRSNAGGNSPCAYENNVMIKILNKNVNQIKNGKWKEFNKHAVLIAEGLYVNNQKHGLWKEYYDHTGTIMIEEEFKDGVKHGIFTSYHPNGQVFSQGEFINGLREGYFRIFDEDGINVRSLLFINNAQIEDIDERTQLSEIKRENRN